jgi:hypothetical protein
MLPPEGRNWHLISPHYGIAYQCVILGTTPIANVKNLCLEKITLKSPLSDENFR